MPKKKDVKPLLATKFDFIDSLDALISGAIMLDQSLRIAFELSPRSEAGDLIISKAAAQGLHDHMVAFRALVFTE